MSKIEARELRLESVAFDLRSGIKEVCIALAKGLEVILRIDPALPERMIGDKLRVCQILFNLIGNAVKFTDRGEVRVQASVCPSHEFLPGPHLLLEVSDTGIGIPADQLGGIFERFWQADASATRRYSGTGLGTTIARDLTRLTGGHIGVDSEVGQQGGEGQLLPGPPAPAAGGGGFGSGNTRAGAARRAAGVGVRAQCHATDVAPGGPPRCGHAL